MCWALLQEVLFTICLTVLLQQHQEIQAILSKEEGNLDADARKHSKPSTLNPKPLNPHETLNPKP